jgi:hypothetical protein
MEILSKKHYGKRKSFKLIFGKMAILSRRGIKCKGVVMNSKKVTKQKFQLFYKFSDLLKIRSIFFLKKNIFFFPRPSLRGILSKIFSKFHSDSFQNGQY